MDTDTLVENLIDDGRKLVAELPRRGFDVPAAFWLKTSEDMKWRFYIVSPVVDAEGILVGYGRLLPLVREKPPLWDNPTGLTLLGPSHPIARDVLAILARTPDPRRSPIRWPGIWLGDKSIEAAYIYPPADHPTLTEKGDA